MLKQRQVNLCSNDPGEMAASWASVRTEEVRRGG